MRNQKDIDLIYKHNVHNGMIFSGVKHVMVMTNRGTGFQAIDELPKDTYVRMLKMAKKKEEQKINERLLRPIIEKYNLHGLKNTAQWRDSLDSLIQFCSFGVDGEVLKRIKADLINAGLTFKYQ
ncbi:hypothetical protein OCT63_19825 [Vibrio sp. RW]|uniref:hypothetical protein n=1 Tax=Vibrio sp. RW TaxID=2998833 RepID=UPI0022CDB587|nr:hypothetical protein [Vibrio sp. RW]MDA0146479.1 hypothetical protein [Vibrio sp. RW]